jgi:hypothetical protein
VLAAVMAPICRDLIGTAAAFAFATTAHAAAAAMHKVAEMAVKTTQKTSLEHTKSQYIDLMVIETIYRLYALVNRIFRTIFWTATAERVASLLTDRELRGTCGTLSRAPQFLSPS